MTTERTLHSPAGPLPVGTTAGTVAAGNDPRFSSGPWQFASGRYYFPWGQPGNDGVDADGANALCAFPFPVSVATTFDRIGTYLATAQANTSIRVGVYDSVGGIPTNLIVESGPLDSTVGGGAALLAAINTTLPAGLYFIATVWQGVGPTMPSISRLAASVTRLQFSGGISAGNLANLSNLERYFQNGGVSGALPALFGTTSKGNGDPVRCGLLRAL